MKIIFEGPQYFGQADEDRFFEWIYSLPAYVGISGEVRDVHLELSEPVDPETVRQLLVLFWRWGIDTQPLMPLRSPATDHPLLWDMANRSD